MAKFNASWNISSWNNLEYGLNELLEKYALDLFSFYHKQLDSKMMHFLKIKGSYTETLPEKGKKNKSRTNYLLKWNIPCITVKMEQKISKMTKCCWHQPNHIMSL